MKIAMLVPDNRDEFRRYSDPDPYFGAAPAALLEGLAGISSCEVHLVCCVQKPLRSPERLSNNVYYHSLLVPKWGWMRGAFAGCILAVRKKLRQIRPQIVHGQGTERYSALAAVCSGFPNVVTIHGNMRQIAGLLRPRPFSYVWLAAKLEGFTIPRSDGVVCITNYTRRAVGALAKRTWVLPNAVDSKFFDLEPTPNGRDAPMLLCVGDVGPRKNQNAFIQALDPIASSHKFRVVFLGRIDKAQPYAREFRQLLESRPWCSYEGYPDRDKLRPFFQNATALVLPSLEDNCPMVVLEAMAAGVPTLASNVGGIPDLIQPGRNGLLCDPLDSQSIRAGVERLLEGPEFRQTIGAEGRRHARGHFHPSVIARRHLEIYQESLRVPR